MYIYMRQPRSAKMELTLETVFLIKILYIYNNVCLIMIAATPVGPTENDNPKPVPWIIAVYTFVVVLLTISFTVLFIWCRRRKSKKDTGMTQGFIF